jgi:ribosomal protein S18 acetylase RimI-like enzyme
MPAIQVRSVLPADLPVLINIDHTTLSEYVWQMGVERNGAQVAVKFEERRLPRPAPVYYPRNPRRIADLWRQPPGLLVAVLVSHESIDAPVGYVLVEPGQNKAARITGLAVEREKRLGGVGTALLIAAQDLARENDYDQVILETHAKNVPAIRLAQKLGFDFCGYQDRYFSGREIALFFGKSL